MVTLVKLDDGWLGKLCKSEGKRINLIWTKYCLNQLQKEPEPFTQSQHSFLKKKEKKKKKNPSDNVML